MQWNITRTPWTVVPSLPIPIPPTPKKEPLSPPRTRHYRLPHRGGPRTTVHWPQSGHHPTHLITIHHLGGDLSTSLPQKSWFFPPYRSSLSVLLTTNFFWTRRMTKVRRVLRTSKDIMGLVVCVTWKSVLLSSNRVCKNTFCCLTPRSFDGGFEKKNFFSFLSQCSTELPKP